MFSVMGDPRFAARIARQQIDDRIRDAEARRTARAIRRAARSGPATPAPRRGQWFRLQGRTGADHPGADQVAELDPSASENADRVLID